MEIIEKEKIIENPSYNRDELRRVSGRATGGLVTGIIGTALGAWALFGNKRGGVLGGAGELGAANININGVGGMGGNSRACPTAYEVQMKECEDVLALQAGIYNLAQNMDSKILGVYQSQNAADFALYKSQRDADDAIIAKHNQDAFNLYASQRNGDDVLANRISGLECKVAVSEAVRPYQDKLIQCEIDKAFTAGINYVDRKTCKMISGEVVLPNTPVVSGFGSYGCNCVGSSKTL